ncbi:hypothetical protein NOW31_RS25675, partial [Escherichia coli]
ANYGRNCSLFSAGTDSLSTSCSNISLCFLMARKQSSLQLESFFTGAIKSSHNIFAPCRVIKKISGIPAIG